MTKNKIITLVFVVLAIVSLALIYIFRIRKNNKSIPVTEGVAVVPTFDDEISSDSSYCATFQLVWNDMKNEIIKKDIVFNPEEIMATNLNKESFTEDMISDSYYFKAFGPKTIKLKEEIVNGIKEKFNQTSDILDDFDWGEDALDDPDLRRYFFYTMLYREFEYKQRFTVLENSNFGNYEDVKYFGVASNSSSEVRNQIIVLFYNSKDDFAIKLTTKSNDEVIFYKNPKGKTFNEIYSNMTNDANKYTGSKNFSNNDTFKVPMINFNVKREYNELQNKPFYDDENREYVIEKAVQTINFKLDEKGGRVKSEAAIDTNVTSAPVKESRNFNVDDTFAIFLKESSRDMPYFAARIDNIKKYQQYKSIIFVMLFSLVIILPRS